MQAINLFDNAAIHATKTPAESVEIIKALLTERYDEFNGTKTKITFAPEALEQSNKMMKLIEHMSDLDINTLTPDEFDVAESLAGFFHVGLLSGVVVDNVIQPADAEEYQTVYDRVDAGLDEVAKPHALFFKLLNALFNERGGFYR